MESVLSKCEGGKRWLRSHLGDERTPDNRRGATVSWRGEHCKQEAKLHSLPYFDAAWALWEEKELKINSIFLCEGIRAGLKRPHQKLSTTY